MLHRIEQKDAEPLQDRRGTSLLVYGVILVGIASQLALAFTDVGAIRLVARAAVFGMSLALLLLPRKNATLHPAAKPAMMIFIIVTLSLLHPLWNTLLAAVAQAALYFAILGPIFWVPRLGVDGAAFRRAILMFWAFNAASAAVGILQVYFPGRFEPNLSSVVAASQESAVQGLYIMTSTGQRLFRPMGLTDVPGGAASGGFYAVLFGTGLLLTSRRWILTIAAPITIVIGLAAIYLSYVRVLAVAALIFLVALAGLLLWRRRFLLFGKLGVVALAALFIGFSIAMSIGGTGVAERFGTLLEDSPTQVYYANRGFFLEYTLSELVPEFPLGAGLGRWGMTNLYFGETVSGNRGPIWVEIQWTGWLLDGGIPLVIAYAAALAVAIRTAWAMSREQGTSMKSELALWAGIIAAYDVTAVATTFNHPFFISQAGMEFWFLNAALFSAVAHSQGIPAEVVSERRAVRS